jgi:hypothetical protein
MSIYVKVLLNTLNNLDISFIFCIFVQDLKLEVMTYKDWCSKLQWLRDKVILPDGTSLSKADYITKDGFDIKSFNELLYNLYEKQTKEVKYFNDEWN